MLVLLPLTACTPTAQSGAGGDDTRAEDEAAIRDLRAAFGESQAAGDAERVAAFYADDAIILNPGDASTTGIGDIRAGIAAFHEEYEWSSQEPIEALQVEGDLAFTRTAWSAVRIDRDTGEAMEASGKSVHIYRRQSDGTWKIVTDIFNFDHPVDPVTSP